jgi:hypothetical protein
MPAAPLLRLFLRASGLPSLQPPEPDDRFARLADRVLAGDPGALEEPEVSLLDLVRWLAGHRDVLFHGSSRSDLELLEPVRLTRDASEFGDQQAVFATDDPAWALWFAVLRRDGLRSTRNGSFGIAGDPLYPRRYFFSVDDGALPDDRFGPGFLYVLPRAPFRREPARFGLDTAQWASPVAVRPLARAGVSPGDFPFLDLVLEHRREPVLATMLRAGVRARRHRRGRCG